MGTNAGGRVVNSRITRRAVRSLAVSALFFVLPACTSAGTESSADPTVPVASSSPCASTDPTTVAETFVDAVRHSDVATMAACQDPLHPCLCYLRPLMDPGLRVDQIHTISDSGSASGGLSPKVTVSIPLPDLPPQGQAPGPSSAVTIVLDLDLHDSYVVDEVFAN